jgi:hypothetical protein
VLFVHAFLPEGVTICDVNVFAAMIEEAYKSPTTLLLDVPDVDGNQRYRGVGNNGIWEWGASTVWVGVLRVAAYGGAGAGSHEWFCSCVPGSGSNLVKSWRGSVADGEQDPFAEERQAGSSEHLGLDRLDAVLDRSSA